MNDYTPPPPPIPPDVDTDDRLTLYIWPDGQMVIQSNSHSRLSPAAVAEIQRQMDAVRDQWRTGDKAIILGPEWRIVPVAQ